MRVLAPLLFCGLCLLGGCVIPGQTSYINDPLTGGVDASSSNMLHIPLPAGLQYYPSHSKISGGVRKEGLEVWRGYIDQNAAIRQIYQNMKQRGWHVRLMQNAGARALCVYQKDNELAAIAFQKQGALTIVQIWLAPRLADNAEPLGGVEEEPLNSIVGEEYPPADKGSESTGKVETWGVQEREL